jgi:transaldolase
MEIWLDSCNPIIINEASERGLICGITTNPKILKSSSKPAKKTIEKLLEIQTGPVTWQVESTNAQDMIEEGINYFSLSPKIIVKIPVTKDGLKAIHALKKQNIPTLATVIYDPIQALMASKAGANLAAVYIGRMEDARLDWQDLLQKSSSFCNIMGASLRSIEHYLKCQELGCKAVTVGDKLFEKLISDNLLTLKSLEEFRSL